MAPTTWKDVALEIVKQSAAIIGAVSILLGAVYRWFFKPIRQDQAKQIANQEAMKVQLDGHTKLLRKASKAQGKYEGLKQARVEAQNNLEQAVKTVKVVAKRAPRRSTDKS